MFSIGIIGRPNVGKSTLFNKLAGKRISITDDRPGVTRDRVETEISWAGKTFTLVDTAGFDLKEEIMKQEMHKQVNKALDTVDFFILVTDGVQGVHPLDEIVVKMLYEKGKKFLIAVNKIDTPEKELLINDFYRLGAKTILPISAAHSGGLDDLLDTVVESFSSSELDDIESEEEEIKDLDITRLAVVGRPNVGKSSLINAWLGEERVIVTPIAGTTRDSIDVKFSYGGDKFLLTDTAGIRKKSVMFKDGIERTGYYKSLNAIKESDIVVAVIDGVDGFNERDVKVIAEAWECGRPIIIAINKWDLAKENSLKEEKLKDEIFTKANFLTNPPIVFISAATGRNVFKILQVAKKLFSEYEKRIPTSKVNDILKEALERHQPPVVHNRRLKFYYMTQVAVKPPQFIVFVNYAKAVHFSYQRFLINILREKFGFHGVPITVSIRQRVSKEEEVKTPLKKPSSRPVLNVEKESKLDSSDAKPAKKLPLSKGKRLGTSRKGRAHNKPVIKSGLFRKRDKKR